MGYGDDGDRTTAFVDAIDIKQNLMLYQSSFLLVMMKLLLKQIYLHLYLVKIHEDGVHVNKLKNKHFRGDSDLVVDLEIIL